MAEPRPSTDAESAPLLRSTDADEDNQDDSSILAKLAAWTEKPLSFSNAVLLGLCLVLLLLSSIFIGLFAGAQHRLGSPSGSIPSVTTSYTLTHTWTETSVSTQTNTITVTEPAPPAPTSGPKLEPCTSTKCIVLSAAVLSSLDESYDPCEDFYLFANGGWLSQHPIPSDKGTFGQFENVQLQNEGIIRTILEAPIPANISNFDNRILTDVKHLYDACMDEGTLDVIGMKPLFDIINITRGLYNGSTSIEPQLWNRNQHVLLNSTPPDGLTAAVAYLHSRDIGALFSFDIDGDVGVDPDDMTLWFWQPDLGLPSKEYYEEKEALVFYQTTIEKLLLVIFDQGKPTRAVKRWPPMPWPPWGGDDDDSGKPENSTERASRLANEVVVFETRIANASEDLDSLYDPIGSYNPVPFSNLTGTIPQIKFDDYLATFAPRAFPNRVIVTYPPYAESLAQILSNTTSEAIEAYLVTRIALTLSPYLGPATEAWKIVRELQERLAGLKKGAVPDRSEHCARQVSSTLGYTTGRFFVEEAFGGHSKDRAVHIITNVIKAFKDMLPNLSWMDKKSSTAAAQKAAAIEVKVGYPMYPNTESAYSIWAYYSLAKISKGDFFGSVLRAKTAEKVRTWQKLGKSRNHLEWEMFAQTVNAYFNPPANEIVFPAGILRSPWFDVDWPGYLNYGGVGSIAAHELTHAFDSAGRQFNQNGKLEEWWTNSTSANFDVIQHCISTQYSNYTIDDGKGNEVPVNGELTSGENIADAGLINAYRAWKAQYNASYEKGSEYLLPGIKYTREQLFFISFGRTWARNMRPASAVQRIRTDPHSPTKFRVQGTLSNIPEFAKAFNCSVGSKLNPPPEKQCKLWS